MNQTEFPLKIGDENIREETKSLISLLPYRHRLRWEEILQVSRMDVGITTKTYKQLLIRRETCKDVLVSRWHFKARIQNKEVEKSLLETIIESFCRGVQYFGPLWDNVFCYWRGSLEDPKHVLFMRYEDLKVEPCAQVTRLAEFLGCLFTQEEIQSGSVEKILELCSMGNLSSLEINKTGKSWNIFFRKGEVDDTK